MAEYKLKAQTEAFWRDEYQVSEGDLDLITGHILEAGKPQPLEELAALIIKHYLQQEKEAVSRQLGGGRIYRPVDRYQVGEELVFSVLDYAVGRVVDVRPGHNPKYGEFEVIKVAFDDGAQEREFAAGFDHPHPLNRPVEELLRQGREDLSEDDLVRMFEHYVAAKLEFALQENKEFVQFDGRWFLQELLPEIHVGYLNLAEAVIYEAGRPVTAREMLQDLELEATGSEEAQLFALNRALKEDERFDNVGTPDEPIWYLRALEPAAVFERPFVHQVAFRALGGEYIGLTMLDLVEEIGDELDDVETMIQRELTEFRFEVNFPHLYAGTMPAVQQFLWRLPEKGSSHFPITLIDAGTDQRFEVWVVPAEKYICGLEDWYASVGMYVGGQVTLAATEDPEVFTISITPVRSRRSEWVRSASVNEGRLVLQMQRATIPLRCDRNMLLDVPDRESILELMRQANEANTPLSELLLLAFEELAKLSSRGTVHAKSLYSVVNLFRRTGAVPIFAELTRSACFDPVGDGFWAYDPELRGKVYHTPEEMRERPLSSRGDLIKDQVIQYLGR